MLVRLVGQVQEHITTLEKGGRNLTEDAKTDIRHASRLVADANATKQVSNSVMEELGSLPFTSWKHIAPIYSVKKYTFVWNYIFLK